MKNVICKKCGYGWQTKSKMYFVSCPKCNQKVDIREKINYPFVKKKYHDLTKEKEVKEDV